MTERDFAYWWDIPGDWVEPPNDRRGGWSGMLRVPDGGRMLYVKRQRNHLCRTLRHPFGWPTASRERQYLDRVRSLGLLAPVPVFHGVRKAQEGIEAVLVTEELKGFRDLSEQSDLVPEARRLLASALGDRLGILHRARLQHSCLYAKHIMVNWQDGKPLIALIDLEKMRLHLSREAAARRDLEQLRRRQNLFDDADWEVLLRAHASQMRAGSRASSR